MGTGFWGLSLVVLATTTWADVAAAQDFPEHTVRAEGGVAVPLTSPQSSRFDAGGELALGYELRPIAHLGVEARFSAVWLPSTTAAPTRDGFGSYYAPAIGVRGYPLASLGFDLWLGADLALVITGDVARPGLEAAIGWEFDVVGLLRLGPVVRYHHVFQTERALPGASDAGFMSFGLSVAWPGTPTAPRDSDGDGLLDRDDRCPSEPEDADGFEDTDGCPDLDDDSDGVPDTSDACRREPEDADGFSDADGCPDPDNDEDGVADGSDGCPSDPEDRDEFQDGDGCPELDNDGDAIPDASDACVNEPETQNGHEDTDGCPDTAPPPPRTETEVELERLAARVLFPRSRVQLRGESRPAIREIIRLLQEHPEITLLRIEAHASREGTPEFNLELSQRRAATVIRLLVEGGIERSRLEAQAFGDQAPEMEGDTEEAHAYNRRVVFTVVRGGSAGSGAQP